MIQIIVCRDFLVLVKSTYITSITSPSTLTIKELHRLMWVTGGGWGIHNQLHNCYAAAYVPVDITRIVTVMSLIMSTKPAPAYIISPIIVIRLLMSS